MPKLSNAALRLTTGALILNSGIGKLSMDEATYGYLKGMASAGLPQGRPFSAPHKPAEIRLIVSLMID